MVNQQEMEEEIDSGEEAFQKFIVECSESETGQENSPEKNLKTSVQQYEMMRAFTNDNTEEALGKVAFDKLWEHLSLKLNQLGPPKRSSMEWRRVWSVYKYNRKRKRSSGSNIFESVASVPSGKHKKEEGKQRIRRESIGKSSNQETENMEPVAIETSLCKRIVDQLSVLTNVQNVIVENQLAIIKKMDESKEILEKIAKKS